MAETALLTNIGEMIDLAIGTPEVGVVDFCMLQTVLHCLAQQLCVLDKNVELRGSATALPIMGKEVNTVAINEYIVETEKKDAPHKPFIRSDKKAEPDTLLIVERVKKEGSERMVNVKDATGQPGRPPAPAARPAAPVAQPTAPAAPAAPAPAAGAPSSGGADPPRPSMAPQPASIEKLSLVTLSKFNLLEGAVEDLKNRVYGSIPKNEQIIEEVRSQTNLKAITDMWTNLNVSSRLEAAEAGLGKLSSLVQDLINESAGLQDAVKRSADAHTSAPAAASHALAPAPAPPAPAPAPAQPTPAPPAPAPAPATPAAVPAAQAPVNYPPPPSQAGAADELAAVFAVIRRLRDDLDGLTGNFHSAMQEVKAGYVPPPPPSPPPPPLPVISQLVLAPAAAPQIVATQEGPVAHRPSHSTLEIMERLAAFEKKLKECCDKIGKTDGVSKDQMQNFQDQLEYLMKQVANLTQDLSAGKLSPDLIKDLQGLMQLFKTVQEMQEQLKQVHETALQLAAEKEDRQYHMNALLEQIEILKTIKLDREDMVEAMADKADLRMLARKVSHDQFEMACDDLSRGLEHAIGKLNVQEALWQQALDDIQREIETKLDKMELSPVKDFFSKKLRQLQEHLKSLASLRREAEAAGTKKRLLRDVNCISCDAQAVMPMEASAASASKPLPATLSMKPYLSYELDAIRKAQASNMQQRNMHDWETIDKQMAQPKQPQKVRSETDKHICNRYCGGSHTVTTPAQRVARLGHFIKQWGPDVVPLSSGFAAGDDGRMYKVSPADGANVGPGGAVDASCTKKPRTSEAPKPAQKMAAVAECRCME